MWAQLLCPFVFAFFFFCWQDVKLYLGLRNKMVFVDKLCINQTDREKKAKGILGLAGFLKFTDRLILAWSPRFQ